jgi:hypothetical protein
MTLSFERPSKHPTITEEERLYIETSIGESTSEAARVSSLNALYFNRVGSCSGSTSRIWHNMIYRTSSQYP